MGNRKFRDDLIEMFLKPFEVEVMADVEKRKAEMKATEAQA
jgi:hypothetical protein